MGNILNNPANSLIFHPPNIPKEEYYKLQNNQQLCMCTSRNGSTVAFYKIHPTKETIPVKWIVWSHGNASSICQELSFLTNLSKVVNVGVIVYDYQGYGLSEGKPSEQNCYDDLDAVLKYINTAYGITEEDITLVGHSLGTGVVVDYAAKHQWKNTIVLISPYKSMAKVVSEPSSLSPSSAASVEFSMKPFDQFATVTKIGNLICPAKIYHGEDDKLIDISHAKELWLRLPEKTVMPTWFANTGHNNILERINLTDFQEIIFGKRTQWNPNY